MHLQETLNSFLISNMKIESIVLCDTCLLFFKLLIACVCAGDFTT